ncbi:lipopolysaccharide-induced tumor necrosis factor-alpha factor homolog [Symsagittifera roscoffensis]|uniref:lipopolysaccharide-induced tumor necrosis factor-alpha factor homolog n=1 Tax=Symsagittifera roscoffensis TaxID=84072 RepID=UPI00307BE0E8
MAAPPNQQPPYPNPQPYYGQQPPQGMYGQPQPPPPAYAPPPTVIVKHQHSVSLGKYPVTMQCVHCQSTITTRVNHTIGCGAWVVCLAVCFFIGPWGCCLIPFCVDGCKDTSHYCPNCNACLGSKSMM